MTQRKRNLPAKVSEEELKSLTKKAEAEGYGKLAQWIRHKLGLPQVRAGARPGDRRNPAGRKGKGD